MFLERTLEPGRATAESVKRFNVRFSWPKSFLFFFLREMSFLIPENAPDLDVPVEFDIFFSQSKYVRGDEDEDLDAKGVPTVPYPLAYPSKLRNMNGKY